jgi:hypothetical protein
MVIGAASAGLPLAKTPKRRAVQIGFSTYFFLFAIFFLWRSNSWVCGCGRLRAVSLPICEMEKFKPKHYLTFRKVDRALRGA